MKNNKLVFKLNFKNQLYALLPLIFFTCIVGIGLFYFYFVKYGVPDDSIKAFALFVYLLFAIPCFCLHIEYCLNDWNTRLIIDYSNRHISYEKGKQRLVFAFNELEGLEFFGETRGFNNLPNQNYSFCILKIRNNVQIAVSCLVVRNLEEMLSKI